MTQLESVPRLAHRSVAELLAHPVGALTPTRDLWGFNGLHGGLTLALLASVMSARADGRPLVSVTGQFHRAIREPVEFNALLARAGRTVVGATASASYGDATFATAAALFGDPRETQLAALAPSAPPAPAPLECPTFTIPPEFVPVADRTEIRPIGSARPYAGGADAGLSAWIRLVEHDRQPNPLELVFLLDALAPSYTAVLTDVVTVPTLELSVQLTHLTVGHPSPWVLLRARTRSATNGWVTEDLDAWAEDGTLLATGRQVRIVGP